MKLVLTNAEVTQAILDHIAAKGINVDDSSTVEFVTPRGTNETEVTVYLGEPAPTKEPVKKRKPKKKSSAPVAEVETGESATEAPAESHSEEQESEAPPFEEDQPAEPTQEEAGEEPRSLFN